jgi:hypothetical protein
MATRPRIGFPTVWAKSMRVLRGYRVRGGSCGGGQCGDGILAFLCCSDSSRYSGVGTCFGGGTLASFFSPCAFPYPGVAVRFSGNEVCGASALVKSSRNIGLVA